jgi:predicted N-acetyltransferase YhbS
MIRIRSYDKDDYEGLLKLYKDSSLYGGVFDENRDAQEKLTRRMEADADAILIAEQDGQIVGSVSLIEDGRVAWFFRFAVAGVPDEQNIAEALLDAASTALTKRGHHQVLVYTPVGNQKLNARYESLGFTKGSDYTCFWKDI